MLNKEINFRNKKINILPYFFLIFFFFGTALSCTFGILYHLEIRDYLKWAKLEEQINLNLQLNLITNNFETIISDLLFLSKQNELQLFINENDGKQKYKEWISNEYLELCRQKRIYDQIRYIDETGMEIVRVDFNNNNPEIKENNKLQRKKNRYYFKDTFILDVNKVFVSPLDLNIEKGKIETPLKPMIRFGTPVFDNENKKRGVIILNYLAGQMITSLQQASTLSLGNIMLVNSDGYWLCSPNREDEWGFMIKKRKDRKFSLSFPEAWNEMSSSENYQIYNKKGLFTTGTIYPLREGLKSSSGSFSAFGNSKKDLKSNEYYWKIISHIPMQDLKTGTKSLLIKLSGMAILLFLLASIPSWIISKAIVRRKLYEMELYHSANYDRLTNLPNRALFQDRLTQTLKQSKRYKQKFALLFIDLDGFKSVNDALGHGAGDVLLMKTAKRLLECVRDSDTVARMGGDEFTVILQSITDTKNAETLAKKIIQHLSKPFQLIKQEKQIGASIGISIYPENGDNIETLLKKSDEAMYQAKRKGKNNYKLSQ